MSSEIPMHQLLHKCRMKENREQLLGLEKWSEKKEAREKRSTGFFSFG